MTMAKGKYTVKEPEAPEPIPVGMYKAKFTEWEEKENPKYGPYVRLVFEITDGEHTETTRSLVASTKLTKGKTKETTSKLFKVVSGLMGKEPKPDEEISLDDLVGTECQILIEDRPGDDGWQEITKVVPRKED